MFEVQQHSSGEQFDFDRVAMLDIDGVLVTQQSDFCMFLREHIFHPPCVEAFNSFVRSSGVKICVSSTWRIGQTPQSMQLLFDRRGVECEVIGCTPIRRNKTRGEEIAEWMATKRVRQLVVIDDDPDIQPFQHVWVKTSWENGFLPEHIDIALGILNGSSVV